MNKSSRAQTAAPQSEKRHFVLDVLNVVVLILSLIVLIISLIVNINLTNVNNSINQQNLELQRTIYDYVPFVTGFQQEMSVAKYESQSGTMNVRVVIIGPHAGYYNITLANYTLFKENLDLNHQNQVGLAQDVIFRTTTPGANSYDENIELWTMLFPSSDYLPPKSLAARIPVATLVFEVVYYDRQTLNTTESQFQGSLQLSINETGV
jgi:hypothetical protein